MGQGRDLAAAIFRMEVICKWFFDLFDNRTFGAIRSKDWRSVQKGFLDLNPTCAVCGTRGTTLNPLNVHHIIPFHERPELELVLSNLITLCRNHHFLFGHLGNWMSYNQSVEHDAEHWALKIQMRP